MLVNHASLLSNIGWTLRTIAETNGADLLVVLLQILGNSLDLGKADFLRVAANEGHKVKVLALLLVFKSVWGDDLATEATIGLANQLSVYHV